MTRAEEEALKAYPKEEGKVWTSAFGKIEFDRNAAERKGFQQGYEQAEKDTREIIASCRMKNWREGYDDGYKQAGKDTIERVCKWLEENATYTHPRKGIKTCIINLNALREAMEEEP